MTVEIVDNVRLSLITQGKDARERDKKFTTEQKLTEGADEVFGTGDSFILIKKFLEPVFKARMCAEVQA